MLITDNELLRRFTEDKSSTAFSELVQRHLGMVYATAVRKTYGNATLAEDVTQQVFIDLSKKAKQILNHTSLASWLYRGASFAAAKAVRTEEREQAKVGGSAVLMNTEQTENATNWDALAPHLDDVMGDLPETDRQAVLLRYFESRSFREVGHELGVSEEAARKRVDRAVDRMRETFAARGLSTSSGALATGLATCLLTPAPPVLAAAICQTAVLALSSTAIPAAGFITMTKIQTGVAAALAAAAVTTTVVQYRTNLELKEELRAREELPLVAPPERTEENPKRPVQIAALPAAGDSSELFQLRGEVTALRQKIRELTSATSSIEEKEALRQRLGPNGQGELRIESEAGTPFAPNRYYAKELWSDVGLDSPEATLQTALWAVKSGNVARLVEAQHWPEKVTEERKNIAIARMNNQGLGMFPGADAVGLKVESFGGTLQSADIDYVVILDRGKELPPQRTHFHMHNVDGNWRLGKVMMEGASDGYFVPK